MVLLEILPLNCYDVIMWFRHWYRLNKIIYRLRSLNRRNASLNRALLTLLEDEIFIINTIRFLNRIHIKQVLKITTLLEFNSLTFWEERYVGFLKDLELEPNYLLFLKNLSSLDWDSSFTDKTDKNKLAQNVIKLIDKSFPKQFIEFDNWYTHIFGDMTSCYLQFHDPLTVELLVQLFISRLPKRQTELDELFNKNNSLAEILQETNRQLQDNTIYYKHYATQQTKEYGIDSDLPTDWFMELIHPPIPMSVSE